MGLTNEHVDSKILAKIKIHVLTRAELLFQVCYEIPCTRIFFYEKVLFFTQLSYHLMCKLLKKSYMLSNAALPKSQMAYKYV